MDSMENKQDEVRHEGCGCGCSAADSGEKVEKVESVANSADRRAYVPSVDIMDAKGETVLVMDLPGAADGDVDISIEKNVLSIKAQQADMEFEGMKLAYSEYGIGDYQRSFVLSDEVDRDNISAVMKDGVLTLKLPKSSPVSKKIAVGSPS